MAAKKPKEKRPRASKQPQEWVEGPLREDLRKKKPKTATRERERPKRARSEAVLVKPSEGVSYAAILKNLKSRVNPEELGIKIGGIRDTRTKDLLVEVNTLSTSPVLRDRHGTFCLAGVGPWGPTVYKVVLCSFSNPKNGRSRLRK